MRIVKTLAYQLAQKLPLLRNYYAGLDLGQVQALHQASAAFRLLLLKPLQTLLPRDEQVCAYASARVRARIQVRAGRCDAHYDTSNSDTYTGHTNPLASDTFSRLHVSCGHRLPPPPL